MIQDNRKVRFRQAFRQALAQNEGHDRLLALVRRYKDSGVTQQEAYDDLQAIWRDYGFDNDNGDDVNPTRDNLEYVMEVVWGFCSSQQAIWDKSLSEK